jgi:hypothetical protein
MPWKLLRKTVLAISVLALTAFAGLVAVHAASS